MGDQVETVTNGVQDPITGLQDKAEEYTSGVLSTLDSYSSQMAQWATDILDKFFPPEQRAAIWAKIQEFMLANPKLSAFLGMNLALTGIPLGIFIVFGLSVATFALIVGVVVGLGFAALFSLTCIGIALAFVFPIIFFTTMVACFLFLWGLGGYYLLKWLNGSDAEGEDATPLLSSGSIGDTLNSLTGGRLTGFVDNARAERAQRDITGSDDAHTKPKPPKLEGVGKSQAATTDKSKRHQQGADNAITTPTSSVKRAAKATGVESKVKTATGATGMVKGGLSGATGLG